VEFAIPWANVTLNATIMQCVEIFRLFCHTLKSSIDRRLLMRTFPEKLLDFWDDLGIWNQYGIVFVTGIVGFVVTLETLYAVYHT